MKFIVLFFLILMLASNLYAQDCAKLRKVTLEDFEFQFTKAGRLEARGLAKKQPISVGQVKMWSGTNQKSIRASIVLKDSDGKVCQEIPVEVDPLKLCKNADGSFDSWRFVLCKEAGPNPCPYFARPGAISIIGSRTSLWSEQNWTNVKVEDSSVCGATQLTGQVTIVRSFLNEKSF